MWANLDWARIVGLLTGLVIIFIVVGFIFVAGPIVVIWSLNQLFHLGIEVSVLNWMAVVILLAVGRFVFGVRIINKLGRG
jgi:hypothetical protein